MIIAAWATSLLLAIAMTWLLASHDGSHAATTNGDHGQARKLAADTEDLRQQLANLTRADQVAAVAAEDLRRTLADRDEQIIGLRNDLAFYSRLVSGGQHDDLTIQDARVSPIGATHAWDVTLTLTQNTKRGMDAKGRATLAVEGLQGGKVVLLAGEELGDAAHADGLPFSFKYFEQLHATIALPADFKPVRLRIGMIAEGSDPATRTIAWTNASPLAGDSHVQ